MQNAIVEEFNIRKTVLSKFPLLGSTLDSVEIIASETFPVHAGCVRTACTTGNKILYSPSYIDSLTREEKISIFAHETMHIALDHIKRRDDKVPKTWNIATDAVINQIILENGLPLGKGWINKPEASGKSAEEMYELLIKEQDNNQNQSDSGNQSSDSSNSNGSKDFQSPSNESGDDNQDSESTSGSHDAWGDLKDEMKKWLEENGYSDSDESEDNDEMNNKSSENNKNNDRDNDNESDNNESDKKEKQELEKNFNKKNNDKKEELGKQIKEHLKQKANKEFSNQIGNGNRSVGKVDDPSKKVLSWRQILSRSLDKEEDRWSYRRASRDNGYGARIESLTTDDLPNVEVMLDTSGSVSTKMLKSFLSQLKPLVKDSDLKVCCFDTKTYGFAEIKNKSDIDNFRVEGGGGTNLDCALRGFTKDKDSNKIIFTDGFGIMPSDDLKNLKNVYWILYDHPSTFEPCCGKIIRCNSSEFESNISSENSEIDDSFFDMI